MKIEITNPESEAAQQLIAESDAYMASLYPAESNHLESVRALQRPNVVFLGAYLDQDLVACGAVKILHDDVTYGEIKRVFVIEQHRGQGLSKAIMEQLERHLRAQSVTVARLETGIRQPEAIGLYRKLGYVERDPFGNYRSDPLSLFMEKNIR